MHVYRRVAELPGSSSRSWTALGVVFIWTLKYAIDTEFVTVSSPPQANGNSRGYFVRLGTWNFVAFAPDGLTSVGGNPGDEEKAAELFKMVDERRKCLRTLSPRPPG